MIDLTHIRARVVRLHELANGLGKEVALWKAQEGPLLPVERKKYTDALYDVIAGTDAAAVVLETALVRLGKLARETGGLLP